MPFSSLTDADSILRLFRARVFKPTEGVFLFHPRAMERLIAEHLAAHGYETSVPALTYYLMAATDFLSGLESENPEALAIIEGLNLPAQVILLPMPVEQRLDAAGFTRLLRDYWARRFEAEVARMWQAERDLRHDDATAALSAVIGVPALAEIRDLLTRDGVIPAGLSPALMTRSFVAFIVRLHYFSPGVRGFFFPAIPDWTAIDNWLYASGLHLTPVPSADPLPTLLQRLRPDERCGAAAQPLRLPNDLPYARTDASWQPPERQTATPPAPAPAPAPCEPTHTCPLQRRICVAALAACDITPAPVTTWRGRLRDVVLSNLAPLLDTLLALPRPFWWYTHTPTIIIDIRQRSALLLLRHALRTAAAAERRDQFATVIDQFAAAQRRLHHLGTACANASTDLLERITHRRQAAERALPTLLAQQWNLDANSAHELSQLVSHLGAASLAPTDAWTARTLLHDLERVLLESRTTYYELRPLVWLLSMGKTHLRQVLPFQANLKALRALDTSLTRLEQLGWEPSVVERFHQPLHQLARQLTVHLEQQLKPYLQHALTAAGFCPHDHREAIAAHKVLRELLDVIEHRRHLKFTDVRDIVARNLLRLPDFSAAALVNGDRLAQFDRSAAHTLPGVYKPGEFYLKGLQQLGAPLFGTAVGRLIVAHLILPFGLAFLGLKTLHVLIDVLTHHSVDLTPLWLVIAVGTLINVIVHAQGVRTILLALLRGLWWGVRLLLYDGLRRFLRWQPLLQLLDTTVVRSVDRHLLRPFFIGSFLLTPIIAINSLIAGEFNTPEPSVFALALALGTLVRNTPAGRHLLDDTASGVGRVVRIVNQTLIIGLVRELIQFFKEVTRRFQQGLHWIEELLSHRLGESRLELILKALLVPIWRLLDALIQFYVTVLVEPQVNPIKHFPLVTIGHKLMLPFFPLITSFLLTITATVLPKWVAYPVVTITVLLLPGLAGFLVWELKENWKLYAANHRHLPHPTVGKTIKSSFFKEKWLKLSGLKWRLRRSWSWRWFTQKSPLPTIAPAPMPPVLIDYAAIELAIIGHHGETMRGLLQRGFHSGTLPKAFDRLRRVLRTQIRTGIDTPQRLRDARRHLAEIERAICVFCERELAYALRRRCREPNCDLVRVETQRPRLATASFELKLMLYSKTATPTALNIHFFLLEPDLFLTVTVSGDGSLLREHCWQQLSEDLQMFSGRAGAKLMLVHEHLLIT